MKLKQFYFSLFSIETFLKKWNDTIYSSDAEKIAKLCAREKTQFFIKKILTSDNTQHKDILYERIYNLLRTNELKIVKLMLDAGLDINYQPLTFIQGLTFGIDNNKAINPNNNQYTSTYDAILVMNTLLEYGLDVNAVHHDKSSINILLDSILSEKTPHSFFRKNNTNPINTELTFNDPETETFFLNNNKSLQALYVFLQKDINLKQQGIDNIIPLVIKIRSQTLMDAILDIKSIDIEYLKEGIKKSKDNSMTPFTYSENMYDYLIFKYEKKLLETTTLIHDENNAIKTKSSSRKKI